MKCRPRVPHDTLGEQLRYETSPEGAARQCRGTTWGWNVALGDGRITGGLQDRFMEGSSATESRWNVAQGFLTARLGNDKGMKCRPRVSHDTLGEQLRYETSPKGAARQCRGTTWGRNVALETGGSLDRFMEGSSATESCWNVAQGFLTARLGNNKGMKRRPRVSHDTLGEQLRHETSPKGAARQCRGTTWGRNVALETGGSLDRFMEGSSATESCWNVAQGFRTTRLGNDKGMKCRPRVSHGTHGKR